MAEQAIRIDGYSEIIRDRICYWKADDGYYIFFPNMSGVGRVKEPGWKIIEHPDGKITVEPSIKVSSYRGQMVDKMRHGYLVNGEWQPCGDDQPG